MTIVFEISKKDIRSLKTLSKDLKGEFVKVKSGEYDNLAMGFIEEINKITPITMEFNEIQEI